MIKEDIKWVTGIKGYCCVSVVLLHLLACIFPAAQNAGVEYLPYTGIYNFVQLTPFNILVNGSFAVYIFWILSSFLLTRSYINNKSSQMLARKNISKFTRIFSSVVVVSIVAFGLLKSNLYFHIQAGELLNNSFWINERDYSNFGVHELITELLWDDWTGKSMLIPPLWTIKFEFIGSLLVSALLATGQGENKRLLFFLLALLIGSDFAPYMCFISGILLAYSYGKNEQQKYGKICFTLGIIMGAYPPTGVPASGIYAFIYNVVISKINVLFNTQYGTHIWYCIAASLIILGVTRDSFLQKHISNKVALYLGKKSFYVYICHIPVMWSLGAYIFYMMYTQTEQIFISGLLSASAVLITAVLCASALDYISRRFLSKITIKMTRKLMPDYDNYI